MQIHMGNKISEKFVQLYRNIIFLLMKIPIWKVPFATAALILPYGHIMCYKSV